MEGIEFTDGFLDRALWLGLQFIIAVICGGVIGIEREQSGKPAGLRTNVLVCVGSMLFTIVSFEMARMSGGDATRIAAQIVTGIGFLGAGAILHETGKGITGMTTAAMIWMIAALGVMVGAGMLVMAVSIALLTTIVMVALKRIERFINEREAVQFAFDVPTDDRTHERVEGLLSLFDEAMTDVKTSDQGDRAIVRLRFTGSSNERHEFLQQLYKIEGARKCEEHVVDADATAAT